MRVERAVQIHEEVEVRVIGPRLAWEMEGVMDVRHVSERERGVETDREAVKHNRVFQLFSEILRFHQLCFLSREEVLGQIQAGRHEAKEALVARALPFGLEHLDEEGFVFLRERLPPLSPKGQ